MLTYVDDSGFMTACFLHTRRGFLHNSVSLYYYEPFYSGTYDNGLPITETSTMWTRGCGPELLVPIYIAISIQQKPPYSEIRTLKSHPNGQNQYKFPSEGGQSHARLTYCCERAERYLPFLSHFYSFYNVLRPLCTQGALI